MPDYRPLNDNILVLVPEQAKETAGGIILPDTMEAEKPSLGKAVAVGPGRLLESGDLIPMSVSVGDTVLFGTYAGIEMKINNQKFLVIRQEDILLVQIKESNDVADSGGG